MQKLTLYTLRLALVVLAATAVSCAGTRRSAYMGDEPPPPPTVLMPSKLSDRERQFAPEVETALRTAGMVPIYRGRGEMQLEFEMLEGPINTDTRLRLLEDGRVLASGDGRGSGPPLVRRERVAENSFQRAMDTFSTQLDRVSQQHSLRPPTGSIF